MIATAVCLAAIAAITAAHFCAAARWGGAMEVDDRLPPAFVLGATSVLAAITGLILAVCSSQVAWWEGLVGLPLANLAIFLVNQTILHFFNACHRGLRGLIVTRGRDTLRGLGVFFVPWTLGLAFLLALGLARATGAKTPGLLDSWTGRVGLGLIGLGILWLVVARVLPLNLTACLRRGLAKRTARYLYIGWNVTTSHGGNPNSFVYLIVNRALARSPRKVMRLLRNAAKCTERSKSFGMTVLFRQFLPGANSGISLDPDVYVGLVQAPTTPTCRRIEILDELLDHSQDEAFRKAMKAILSREPDFGQRIADSLADDPAEWRKKSAVKVLRAGGFDIRTA